MGFAHKDAAYFGKSAYPKFHNNAQYQTERIGEVLMPPRIDFQTPRHNAVRILD